MKPSVKAGLTGALTVTALHQVARAISPRAPRLDTLGRRLLARILLALGITPPRGAALQYSALLGDLFANSIFYGLVGSRRPVLRGAALGSLAGYGAVKLPPKMRLGWLPTRKSRATKRMAFAWYLAGGLAAGLAARTAVREYRYA